MELRWQGRALTYAPLERPSRHMRQIEPVDGKQVNALVDSIVLAHPSHQPKIGHPWRKAMPKPDPSGIPVQARFDQNFNSTYIVQR